MGQLVQPQRAMHDNWAISHSCSLSLSACLSGTLSLSLSRRETASSSVFIDANDHNAGAARPDSFGPWFVRGAPSLSLSLSRRSLAKACLTLDNETKLVSSIGCLSVSSI